MIDISREISYFPPGAPGPEPVHVGLVYPNTYRVSLASLGFQTVHLIAHRTPGIVTHRIVLENTGGDDYPSRTLEERLEIKSLDALLVTCSFELDYFHLVRMLHATGIPPIRRQRGNLPLVIVGGTAPTANPEPLAPFADAIVIGEAEVALERMLDDLIDSWPLLSGSRFARGRDELYEAWDQISGVYVPALWEDAKGGFSDRGGERVKQVFVPEIDSHYSYTPIVSPDGVYGSKNLVEISKGCSTHCRFCLISHISPERTRSRSSVLENARVFPPEKVTVGLVSSAVSDHPEIIPIIDALAGDGYGVSVSSLKIPTTSRELLHSLVAAGAQSVTFAPEHGSEKIRQLVCKPTTYEDTRSRIEWAFDEGISKIKLYFITGFEEEDEADVLATGEFIQSLARDLGLGSRASAFRFTIGLAPFVPKASTPFQRRGMEDEPALKRKMKAILDPLRKQPRIDVEMESPRESIIQGALAQGDRGLVGHLAEIAKSRGSIIRAWDEAIIRLGDQPRQTALRLKKQGEKLPWGFIIRPKLK
jgi:radical SAM superfamily enzyme YgiQ (UPF0313 family)